MAPEGCPTLVLHSPYKSAKHYPLGVLYPGALTGPYAREADSERERERERERKRKRKREKGVTPAP